MDIKCVALANGDTTTADLLYADLNAVTGSGPNQILVTYNNPITATAANTGKSQWSITVGTSNAVAASYASVVTGDTTVRLTTDTAITAADTVKVAYTRVLSGNQFVTDLDGDEISADYLNSATAVTNSIAPAVSSIVAVGPNEIHITYNAGISTTSANDGKTQFTITIGSNAGESAAGISVSGSKVTLTTTTTMVS